jgi:sulfide:quinone oxidoreductase
MAERARILIAGGGIAGIEAALALRAFAGERAEVEVIDPAPRFTMAATSPGRVVGLVAGIEMPLGAVVRRAGATLRRARVAAVDPARHVVMLAGGELVTYDALVVAVGAHPEPHLPDAITFSGHADVAKTSALVDGMARAAARGARTDLAVVVPPGSAWPLAAYELAILIREHLVGLGHESPGRTTVVTAEDAPLAVFGPEASDEVGRWMRSGGVDVLTGAVVRSWRWGQLDLAGGDPMQADRVIALPVLRGPGLEELPADAYGFVHSTPDGRVPDVADVWVAGDAGAFPVKQGGIACQQADAIASAIARELGADAEEVPFLPVLRGWVWDEEGGRFLRADLGGGRTESAGVAASAPLWSPPAKVAGRFLAPFLRELEGQAAP